MAVTCLRCAHPDWAGGTFCTECDAPLPLTEEDDDFSTFGLDRALGLDPGRLKFAYFELDERVHRDGHASDSSKVQEATLRRSAFLSEEYLVLPDPVGHHLDESAYTDRALQAVEESRTPEASGKGNES